MNDWELFEAMNEAEKRFEALKAEFRARGLHNKPFYEYSHSRPTPRAVDLPCCCAEIESAGIVNPDCPRHGLMRANR